MSLKFVHDDGVAHAFSLLCGIPTMSPFSCFDFVFSDSSAENILMQTHVWECFVGEFLGI